MIGFLQIFIAEAAAQALLSVAVDTLQLYQCLGVARRLRLQSHLFPRLYDMILLRAQCFEQIEGAVAELLVALVTPVGEEHGHSGVDGEQGNRGGRESLLAPPALQAKEVVGLPVGCHTGGKQFGDLVQGGAVHQARQSGAPLVIEACELNDADSGKILRTQAQETP